MKHRIWKFMLAAALTAGVQASAQGQNHSVQYLVAALGSIPNRAAISVQGAYSTQQGMVEARGSYLRNKGYSRLVITDPETGVQFSNAYCAHDSSVFNELLNVTGTRTFVFHGYKGRGEGREDAFFVTSLTAVAEAKPAPASDEADNARTFRVTIVDNETSVRTVLDGVELGKPFNLPGSILVIERDQKLPDRVRIWE